MEYCNDCTVGNPSDRYKIIETLWLVGMDMIISNGSIFENSELESLRKRR
jgi:hypothetical protein